MGPIHVRLIFLHYACYDVVELISPHLLDVIGSNVLVGAVASVNNCALSVLIDITDIAASDHVNGCQCHLLDDRV